MTNEKPNPKARTNPVILFWQFLTSPHFSITEVGERRRAQVLSTITLILTVFFIWGIFSNPTAYTTFFILFGMTLFCYTLSRSRYYRAGTYFFSYGFTAITYLSLYLGTASGFTSSITSVGHVAIIVASVLLSIRGFTALVFLSTIATFSAPYYSQVPVSMGSDFFRESGVFMSIGLILVGASIFRAQVERDRLSELREVNRELEDIKSNLEARVETRTLELDTANQQTLRRATQLQAVTELSESIAQVRDLGELFPAITKLISERFDFYHVGIFLIDRNRQYAILQAANSEGGKRMLERGHRLKLGSGVVGYAAQIGQPRIALDVGVDAMFFNNPDLPSTRSEAALPINARDETIGVLDVQSVEAGAFSNEDLQVLTTLANQVSIAFENARLFTETRAALTQVQEVYNEFTRAEWSRATAKAEQAGFRYQNGRIEMIEKLINSPEIISAVKTGATSNNQVDDLNSNQAIVAVPVKLRGEVIGVIHIKSNDAARIWQNDELSLIEAVADRAAIALENARLFQDARRRAAKERLISEASSRISGALSVENILQTTAHELERALGGSEVLIRFQSKK